jgi:hypothetical protein
MSAASSGLSTPLESECWCIARCPWLLEGSVSMVEDDEMGNTGRARTMRCDLIVESESGRFGWLWCGWVTEGTVVCLTD